MPRPTPIAHRALLAATAGLLAACATGSAPGAPPSVDERAIAFQERLSPEDGAILSVVSVDVDRAWADLDAETRAAQDRETWERARLELSGRSDLVTYSSDGLRVGALLVRPETSGMRDVGAVLYLRDGIADRGLDEDALLVELSRYADAGYLAAAPAYRGNHLGQGIDEVGGDDVNDVLALIALVQRLDGVDPARVFLVGRGRGGLMVYRALEEEAPVRAAAVISGLADIAELAETDPLWEDGFTEDGGWPGFRSIYGKDWDYGVREEQLERRNPRVRSQDSIRAPLLVVHGRLDETVPVAQAQCVTTRVRKAGVPIENVVYGYGDHALSGLREDWQPRVLDWITRHDTRALFN